MFTQDRMLFLVFVNIILANVDDIILTNIGLGGHNMVCFKFHTSSYEKKTSLKYIYRYTVDGIACIHRIFLQLILQKLVHCNNHIIKNLLLHVYKDLRI